MQILKVESPAVSRASKRARIIDFVLPGGSAVRLPLARVPGGEERLHSATADFGVDRMPVDSYFIFGGLARHILTGESWGDLNLALRELDIEPLVEGAARRPRLLDRPCQRPEGLFRLADFTIAQIVLYAGVLYLGPHTMEHLARRMLVYRRSQVPPAISFLRTYKFRRRSYALPRTEFAKVLRRMPRVNPFAGVDVAYHSDGAILGSSE